MNTAEQWIRQLGMRKHPEGGYFAETYRSSESISEDALPERFGAPRSLSSAIYFLLADDDFSAFHRLRADEIWHFHAGDTLVIHVLEPGGCRRRILLGSRPGCDEMPQAVIPAGNWFAAELLAPPGYALVGCTVAPGFAFDDFDLADAEELTKQFPSQCDLIRRLT